MRLLQCLKLEEFLDTYAHCAADEQRDKLGFCFSSNGKRLEYTYDPNWSAYNNC